MVISLVQYFLKKLEGLSSESFRARQATVTRIIKHERLCELLLKIDAEKLQKKFKSEPTSLYFISLEISGLLTVENGQQLVQWLNDDCDEKPCEKPCDPCDHGEFSSLEPTGCDDHHAEVGGLLFEKES